MPPPQKPTRAVMHKDTGCLRINQFCRRKKGNHFMRMTLAAAGLALATALSGCGVYGNSGPDNLDQYYPNCQEQAAMAQNGRMDGREITITCPGS